MGTFSIVVNDRAFMSSDCLRSTVDGLKFTLSLYCNNLHGSKSAYFISLMCMFICLSEELEVVKTFQNKRPSLFQVFLFFNPKSWIMQNIFCSGYNWCLG